MVLFGVISCYIPAPWVKEITLTMTKGICLPHHTWLWVKNRYHKWTPVEWKEGLKPAVPWWINFDPYPHVATEPDSGSGGHVLGNLWSTPRRGQEGNSLTTKAKVITFSGPCQDEKLKISILFGRLSGEPLGSISGILFAFLLNTRPKWTRIFGRYRESWRTKAVSCHGQ